MVDALSVFHFSFFVFNWKFSNRLLLMAREISRGKQLKNAQDIFFINGARWLLMGKGVSLCPGGKEKVKGFRGSRKENQYKDSG
jgi:hypothetical protein